MKKLFIGLTIVLSYTAFAQGVAPDFKIQVVDNQIDIGYGLALGDVDGDKRIDILLADQKEIVWYRNDGTKDTNSWKRYVMASNLTSKDNVCIAARDIDGDGKVEVAVGAMWNPAETKDITQSGAVFYLIRPADPTQLWEPVRLHHEITTHRMRWAKVNKDKFQLIVVPLHGLGNVNGEGNGVKVLAYDVPKNPKQTWPYHLVDSTLHITHNFEIWEDKDATKILIGSKEGGKVIAYQKNEWKPTGKWIGEGVGVGEVRRGDLPNKGTFVAGIAPWHGNQLVVFNSQTNTKKILTDQLSQGHALACGDFLGLGYSQIAVGWRNPNAEKKVGVRLFVPKDKAGESWDEFVLDESVRMACEDLQAVHLDGDGDLDIVAAGRATLNVLIYWNQRK
ncbi:FG-GAP repeat domain-containing protein [Runella zeae]|uniref:FG-GAP repeat domain-containing protein n=1 Tax=Runella zeae TaxID=94255 RepID=UPI002357F668|nr:VCBS repeat-containing protein [Runella zeae]